MTTADRSRFAEYRDRRRGGPPRTPQPCGTIGAARRHQRASEPLCDLCRPVWAAHQHEQYERRKAIALVLSKQNPHLTLTEGQRQTILGRQSIES